MTSLIAQGIALVGRLAPTDLRVERGELVALVGGREAADERDSSGDQ